MAPNLTLDGDRRPALGPEQPVIVYAESSLRG